MNAEYLVLYSAYVEKDKSVVSVDNLKYFENDVFRSVYSLCVALKRANLPINTQNAIKVAYRAIREPQEQVKVIEEIKNLYESDIMPSPDPIMDLRSQYFDNLQKTTINFLNKKRNQEELKNMFTKMLNKISTSGIYESVQTLGNIFEDYKKKKAEEIFSKISLSNAYLREWLGNDIFGQLYSITGVPGSYKSTILYNIIFDILYTGHKGLHLSWEDSNIFTVMKMIAAEMKYEKYDIIDKNLEKINIKNIEKQIEPVKDNLYIDDMTRNPDELYEITSNYIINNNINFITLDFLQMIDPKNNQTELQALNDAIRVLLNVNKQFNVPIIFLNQTTAEISRRVMDGSVELGPGMEKGTGNIFERVRYAYYITPDSKTQNGDDIKILCGKNTLADKRGRRWIISMNGSSGYIQGIRN